MEKVKRQRKLSADAHSQHACPQCASRVLWACQDSVGHAYCSKSASATRVIILSATQAFCEWEGKCKRRPDGKVEIFYIEEL